MKNVLKIAAVLISFAATSCANDGKASYDGIRTIVIDQSVLDSATVLVVDSTDRRFEHIDGAGTMLVYKDSLLITTNKIQAYGEPIISFYDGSDPLRHLVDYIHRGSDTDEMVACGITIIGDNLFVSDSYYTHRYCTISLQKPLLPPDELHLLASGVEDRGVAIAPFHDGLIVENPQCYSNDGAGIHNDVPRLLHYRKGRCLNPHEPVSFQVEDVNTGADIHYNESRKRICFMSNNEPFVEFYDDSLRLIHRMTLPSEKLPKIYVYPPKTTMHQKRNRGETDRGMSATFDKTQKVVGAENQLHAFLCSAADDEYIYLVYCGKRLAPDFHIYTSYILVLDWGGNLVDTYRFDRWVAGISPSKEKGRFYLMVYANDYRKSAQMKLVNAVSHQTVEADSLGATHYDARAESQCATDKL